MRALALVSSDLTSEGLSAEYGIVVGRGRDDWAARAARSACWEGWDMFLAGKRAEKGRLDSETEEDADAEIKPERR